MVSFEFQEPSSYGFAILSVEGWAGGGVRVSEQGVVVVTFSILADRTKYRRLHSLNFITIRLWMLLLCGVRLNVEESG